MIWGNGYLEKFHLLLEINWEKLEDLKRILFSPSTDINCFSCYEPGHVEGECKREMHQNFIFLLLLRHHPTCTSFSFLDSYFALPNFLRDIELAWDEEIQNEFELLVFMSFMCGLISVLRPTWSLLCRNLCGGYINYIWLNT